MSIQDLCDIGSRRELFVDHYLVDSMGGGVTQRLHSPLPREEVLVTDRPWEGNMCGYITVFQDDDRFRMYYKSWSVRLADEQGRPITQDGKAEVSPLGIAIAESQDGIHWERPLVGQIEFNGSTENNLVYAGAGPEHRGAHGFAPFKDTNPDADLEHLYKAVGTDDRAHDGLFAMSSPDGMRWQLMRDEPIIVTGAFDSQNLVFWDSIRGEYRAYVRDFHGGAEKFTGRRDIRTATSSDFFNWTEPEWLEYPDAPDEQLYTNQVTPYYRAPHIFLGFPTRYVERPWSEAIEALPQLEHRQLRSAVSPRYGTAVTDGLFMSSRNGRTFKRWPEAFIRPGPQYERNWTYGDNYQCWGLLETASDMAGAPPELSFYATENYWRDTFTVFRRYTLRLDGFVSLHATLAGGEMMSKPLQFVGSELRLNLSTSAAGSLRVEIQTLDGDAVPGFSLDDCHAVIGDELDRTVSWQNGPDVSHLARRPIKLRFAMSDADLFSMRFA